MSKNMLLLFNHTMTDLQEHDARRALGVGQIKSPPAHITLLWRQIPAHLLEIKAYLKPVQAWVESCATPGDYVLIQGDFGATCLMVAFAFQTKRIPVYSTTERIYQEHMQPDGSIELRHKFKHCIYRIYERF